MAQIKPLSALMYACKGNDVSKLIAPPYDVLDETSKGRLLQSDSHNIVAIDLPHLPPKTVGPDTAYDGAGRRFQQWLADGVIQPNSAPALFAYRQSFEARGHAFQRMGLIANVAIQPLAASDVGPPPRGAIHPHEQTFSAPKADRLKLMHATGIQLSPVFGMFRDESGMVGQRLVAAAAADPPLLQGRTGHDGVLHELWPFPDTEAIVAAFGDRDLYIADGHHRYTTAVTYMNQRGAQPGRDPAGCCMFVLVPMEDPGMIVLPTHRVLGGMADFTAQRFREAADGLLALTPFPDGDLASLERALPGAGPHALGIYYGSASSPRMAIATTVGPDPLAETHPHRSEAWRQLDVAVVQHLLVERICEPTFTPGGNVTWAFPHDLETVAAMTDGAEDRLGVIMQATPLAAVQQVSDHGELMPPKSTFFYPKLATGMVLNPLS